MEQTREEQASKNVETVKVLGQEILDSLAIQAEIMDKMADRLTRLEEHAGFKNEGSGY